MSKVSQLKQLSFQNLFCKPHPKLDFYGCCYCVVVSLNIPLI